MARVNFGTPEDNAALAGYTEATRLSPITPKNKTQILKDYQLTDGAAKGLDDTAMSRMAAQAVLDKFVRDREEAKRIAREAEEARLRAEAEAKAAAEEQARQQAAAVAAQQAQIQQQANYQAQVAAQQAAIAARSMSRIPAYTGSTAPIRAPQPTYPNLPNTAMPLPYIAPKIIGSVPKYVPPPPPPSRNVIRLPVAR